jgi:hypothetical protein
MGCVNFTQADCETVRFAASRCNCCNLLQLLQLAATGCKWVQEAGCGKGARLIRLRPRLRRD